MQHTGSSVARERHRRGQRNRRDDYREWGLYGSRDRSQPGDRMVRADSIACPSLFGTIVLIVRERVARVHRRGCYRDPRLTAIRSGSSRQVTLRNRSPTRFQRLTRLVIDGSSRSGSPSVSRMSSSLIRCHRIRACRVIRIARTARSYRGASRRRMTMLGLWKGGERTWSGDRLLRQSHRGRRDDSDLTLVFDVLPREAWPSAQERGRQRWQSFL